MNERKNLGDFLRGAREVQSVSQLYVASCLGQKNTSFVSRIENGFKIPSLETSKTLVRVLGLSPERLARMLLDVERVRIMECMGVFL